MGSSQKTIAAEELLGDGPTEFFEDLGRMKSSLSMYSRSRKASTDSSLGKDVQLVDDDDYESDDEPVRPVASWVKTMSHFEMKKTHAEELVREGAVFHQVEETRVVPIQQQGDLELYTYEEQRRRWDAGQSPEFQRLCQDLWRLVRSEDNSLGHDAYVELVSRFHYVCCPPPLDHDSVIASTEQDWRNDSGGRDSMNYETFFRAVFQCVDIWTDTSDLKEYIALLKRLIEGAAYRLADNTLAFKEKDDVSFDAYFAKKKDDNELRSQSARKIQKLVRARKQRRAYADKREDLLKLQRSSRRFLRRMRQQSKDTVERYESPYSYKRRRSSVTGSVTITQGKVANYDGAQSVIKNERRRPSMTDRRPSATRIRRPSIEHERRRSVTDGPQSSSKETPSPDQAAETHRRKGPSQAQATADEVLHRKPSMRRRETVLLPPDQVNAMIAKCYQAKLQADAAAQRAATKGKTPEKSVRFDLFVVRFFQRSHGTIGIAKRHLRLFVRSVEAMLADEPDGWPRVALFADIVGISTRHHNARLCPSFLMPVLKVLYPDVMSLSVKMIRRGIDGSEPVPYATMVEALQTAVPAHIREPNVINLIKAAIEAARLENKLMDPDAALYMAFPIFKRFDALTAYRRKRSASLAVEYAKNCLRCRLAKIRQLKVEERVIDIAGGAPTPAPPKLSVPARKLQDARALDAQLSARNDDAS